MRNSRYALTRRACLQHARRFPVARAAARKRSLAQPNIITIASGTRSIRQTPVRREIRRKSSVEIWWWVRVLPPPGTLIWRLPGFIRPRCTAGATHRLAESYERVALHGSTLAEFLVIGPDKRCYRPCGFQVSDYATY